MAVAERDFNTFYLGDDVRELAHGVLLDIAKIAGVKVPVQPAAEEWGGMNLDEKRADLKAVDDSLSRVVKEAGEDKFLQHNVQLPIGIAEAATLVTRAGNQRPYNRSLQSPNYVITGNEDRVVASGATANIMQQTADFVRAGVIEGRFPNSVYMVIGGELLKAAVEPTPENEGVKRFRSRHNDEMPTQAQFVEEEILPGLEESGVKVELLGYKVSGGSKIAAAFAEDNPDFFLPGQTIIFARVGTAGVMQAGQFVRSARQTTAPNYDTDPNSPQAFVANPGRVVAKSEAQMANPVDFQSPLTAVRLAVSDGKAVNQLNLQKLGK